MVIAAAAGGSVAEGGQDGGGGVAVDAHHVVVDVADSRDDERHRPPPPSTECRICHLGGGELPAESGSPSGRLVRLGCGCRGELAAAHRRCAEAWFSVRGNRRCEICSENAENITGGWGGGGKEFMQRWHAAAAGMDAGQGSPSSKACSGFCKGQSFCNLFIACLIIVFILPWLLLHNHLL
ncbi:uncharacterized protein LOC121054509 [Oryza brachyantha]|uniref:uncharacterized protein LOC121054509 n=1 Tax=Oryza brachyantha TaxID=4533 RepID=UPI001ADA6C58|nr:uncharacterized protein LOC121054509 [Oryza brachyantha]